MRRPTIFLSGLVILGFFCLGFPVLSAAGEISTSEDGDSPMYRKAIKEGVVEYEAQRFEEARSLFRRAHQINPNARTFRGMGMTAFELRDYVSAVRYLSAALRDTRKPLSDEQRKQAQELLDRSSLFVDVYTINVTPRSARLMVDGHLAEPEQDGSLLFAFGRHTIETSAPGMVPQNSVFDVRGGEKKSLNIVLQHDAGSRDEEHATDHLSVTSTVPVETASSNGTAKLLLGLSLGSAVLAGGAGYAWLTENAELRSCLNPEEGKSCSNESDVKLGRNLAAGATIGAGVAALSLAVWGILSWDSATPPSAAERPSLVRCVPGPMAVTCMGRF